jgi:hypothetical protein
MCAVYRAAVNAHGGKEALKHVYAAVVDDIAAWQSSPLGIVQSVTSTRSS